MAKPLVPDELWARIAPLIPPREPHGEKGGRPPVNDRAALTGIVFVLKTGIPWEDLPQEMNCGCGMTCWRRLRDWQEAGVWKELHNVLLADFALLTRSTGRAPPWIAALCVQWEEATRRAQTLPIAGSWAPSIISSSIDVACLWKFSCPALTDTM